MAGKPDIVLPKYGVAIFVHGCFWHRHGCRATTTPATRRSFWTVKFQQTVDRDRRNLEELLNAGWRVLIIWECSLRGKSADVERVGMQAAGFLESDSRFAECLAADPNSEAGLASR